MFVELSGAVWVLAPPRLDGGRDCETTMTDAITILVAMLEACSLSGDEVMGYGSGEFTVVYLIEVRICD